MEAKKMNLISKLFLTLSTCVLAAQLSLYAGIQNNIEVPDIIELYNSSQYPIEVDGSQMWPDQLCHITTNKHKQLVIKQGGKRYTLKFPTYNNHDPIHQSATTAHIDFATVQWLAGDLPTQFPNGIDEITIKNDTLYKIMVIYVLNKIRSFPRTVSPEDTTSKVVRDDTNSAQKTGQVDIVVDHNKKYPFSFTRRSAALQTQDWASIQICANTIKLFNNGYSVSVR